MPKDKTQLLRHIFIDQKIRQGMKSGRLANCTSMAEEYEVSRKSILRDMDYLKNQRDAPIEYDPQKRGYYYTEENYALPAISINESDLFALLIAEKALKQHENTPIYGNLVSVFKKIEKALPDKIIVDPTWIDSRFTVIGERSTRIDPQIWETISKALQKNLALSISYHKPGGDAPSKRKVNPYQVVSFQGEWYLVGHCGLRNKTLTFAVSRITQADLLPEEFTIPDDFDSTQYSAKRFGIFSGEQTQQVKIRFNPETAIYIKEREWHKEQTMEEYDDGSLVLGFETDHLFEVKRWVLSWGRGALVLAPDQLVVDIRDEVNCLAKTYSASQPKQPSTKKKAPGMQTLPGF
ncbi:MAG: WYL domain-containing protein [Proteobacteria bacterium]|nr:WYL domain-containing protein [Pseudomonadota bacterium]